MEAETNDPNRPATPSEEDCCHQGCNPCIFDVHQSLLRDYRKKRTENAETLTTNNFLHLTTYTTLAITSVEKTSDDYLLVSLTGSDTDGAGIGAERGKSVTLRPGQYVMLRASNVVRPFTPISWSNRTLRFLIKIREGGRFSSLLRCLKIGDKIDVRGPYGDFRYTRNRYHRLVMLTAGSGLAAVYPIADAILNDELDETRIRLISGFRTVAQIPLKKQLQRCCDYWNFECTIHVSRLSDSTVNTVAAAVHGISIRDGRMTKDSISRLLERDPQERTLVLICGTRRFASCIEQWVRSMGYSHLYVFKSD